MPHSCRQDMGVAVGEGSVSDWVNRFYVLWPKSMGKVWTLIWTILMIPIINTKVNGRKWNAFYRNFYVIPFPLISFQDYVQVFPIISHNLGFIILF